MLLLKTTLLFQSKFRTTAVERKEIFNEVFSIFIIAPSVFLTKVTHLLQFMILHLRDLVYINVQFSCCTSVGLDKCIRAHQTIQDSFIALKICGFFLFNLFSSLAPSIHCFFSLSFHSFGNGLQYSVASNLDLFEVQI